MSLEKILQVETFLARHDALKGWVAVYDGPTKTPSFVIERAYMSGALLVLEVDQNASKTQKVMEAYNVSVFGVKLLDNALVIDGKSWNLLVGPNLT